jgi:hypothetical protein
MQVRLLLAAMIAMTAANAAMLAVNFSTPSYARVAGMNWSGLIDDDDFRTAVERIVEDCKVNDKSISC